MVETLTEDIILDIVSRVPAKLVGRFRCVSKKWCSLLSDPLFIKAHLAFHKRDQPKLIYVSDDFSLRIITFDNNSPKNVTSSELNFHQCSHIWRRLGGSCNGLVLVLSELSKLDVLYLVNPTTLQYHRICDPPNLDPTSLRRIITHYSLGYDIDSDDYKVVAVSLYPRKVKHMYIVEVYSVRKGLWWIVEGLPCGYYIDCIDGVLVNGAMHWWATGSTDRSIVILAFDLSSEKFSKMPIPSTIVDKEKRAYGLVALGGLLCIYSYEKDVWMMNDYGVSESWTKIEVEEEILFSLTPVVFEYEGKLYVYNKRSYRRLMIVDDEATSRVSHYCTTFTESLVSPWGN